MELPNEIWDIIVKQSIKSNSEFIKDMSIYELYELEYEIKEKRKKIYDTIKKQLNKYDIIKVTHKTDKNAYKCDLLIINLNLNNSNEISVANLNKSNKKCIFGNYKNGDIFNFQIDLNNVDIEVISSLADRNKENIKIANSLKIGDIVVYSKYTSAEWVKYRSRYNDLSSFKNSFVYRVVEDITPQYIIIQNNTPFNKDKQYINKNIVLKKLNFENNEKVYINLKKDYFMDKINSHIRCCGIISSTSNYYLFSTSNYFEQINKKYIKHLINLQRKFNIKRP